MFVIFSLRGDFLKALLVHKELNLQEVHCISCAMGTSWVEIETFTHFIEV